MRWQKVTCNGTSNVRTLIRSSSILLLLAGVAGLEFFYGRVRAAEPRAQFPLSPGLVRAFDMGLHSAVASFRWITTRTEIPFLVRGYDAFQKDFSLITNLDPRWNTPYIYTELVLPLVKPDVHPDYVTSTIEIGEEGVRNADPDWRLPFYLATTYHLYRKDYVRAATYFDAAAQTPGIPDRVRRFAMNYGVYPSARERTKQVWRAIYESTGNEAVRSRAEAYILHFMMLDFLELGVKKYEHTFGKKPNELRDLVTAKIIDEIPRSPFGYEFQLYPEAVGIKPATTK